MRVSRSSLLSVPALLVTALLVTACSSVHPAATPGALDLSGKVFGGEQPITDTTIQLYTVGTSTNGGAATPLISATVTTSDGSGLANANANAGNLFNQLPPGYFNITGDYTCPSATAQVFIAAVGGNPGAGTNNAQENLAALGNCGNLSATTGITVNEITTVGTVAALYPYMTAYNAIGSTIANASALTNAFATAAEYMNFANGSAPGSALPAGYDASSNDIRALANVLQTCVNSTGGTAGDNSPCGNLFTDTTPTSTNVAPTDTVGALIDLFNNPNSNVAAIFNLQSSTPAFAPTYTTPPSNWSLPILPIPGIPAFSVPTGSYSTAQGVAVTDSASGAAIYYTADGSTPTTSSTLYTGPVGVSNPETLSAIAVESTRLISPAGSVAYTGTLAPIAPTVTLSAVTSPSGSTTSVTITATETGTAGVANGSVVTFGVTGTATGSFNPTTCAIASGSCSVSYVPTGTLAPATYPNDLTATLTAAGAYTTGSATSTLLITGVVYTQLHSFTEAAISGTSQTDGGVPYYGSLIQASDGNFYGTTGKGGATADGTIFRISPTGVYTQLYAFTFAAIPGTSQTDGRLPYGGLVEGNDGFLYGTTEGGGAKNDGTLFRISTAGVYTQLYSFTGTSIAGTSPAQTDGARPYSALVQGSDGNFYGTTEGGGPHNYGTVFSITPAGSYTQLYAFAAGYDGANPYGGLLQGSDGIFYGNTEAGGTAPDSTGGGTQFKISPAGVYAQLRTHLGGDYGCCSYAPLIQSSDGNFAGTGNTFAFETSAAGTIKGLHNFGSNVDLYSPLFLGSDGNFYGTTFPSYGTLFKMTSAGTATNLHTFTDAAIPGTSQTDGSEPYAGLVQGNDGSFYGTTYMGGANNFGTLFKLTFSPALPAPVALTVPAAVTHSTTFTLTYTVSNAFSTAGVIATGATTLQNCFATNNAGDTTGWTGSITSSTIAQNITLTAPATAGSYTYTLTCGGQETGLATLTVQ